MSLENSIEHFFYRAIGPSSWSKVSIQFPNTFESWVIVFLLMALFVFSIFLMLYTPQPSNKMAVRVRSENWTEDFGPDHWNVVQVKLSDAKNFWPGRYADKASGFLDKSASIRVGSLSQPCRVLLNQGSAAGVLFMHAKLKEKFDPMFDKVPDVDRGQDGSMSVAIDIYTPWYRPDLMTIQHPDSDIRLQWRLGFIFLILGIIIPEVFRFFKMKDG